MSALRKFEIRRLGEGDEGVLEILARDDADFDVEGRSHPRRPLDALTARDYLTNPGLLFWAAESTGRVVGFLSGIVQPLRSNEGREILLYEIGVRRSWRRHGIGRALMVRLEAWMGEQKIKDIWVLADNPGAVAFYRACGFEAQEEQPVMMTRKISLPK